VATLNTPVETLLTTVLIWSNCVIMSCISLFFDGCCATSRKTKKTVYDKTWARNCEPMCHPRLIIVQGIGAPVRTEMARSTTGMTTGARKAARAPVSAEESAIITVVPSF
jgi:hypothetical protein